MENRFLRVGLACALAGMGLATHAAPALADDPPLVLMGAPTSFTDVADSFDDDDPFDFNLTVSFERSQTSGRIQREAPPLDPSNPMATADLPGAPRYVDVADTRSLTNSLVLGLEAGLYHDLMVYARLPLVLSDDRELRGITRGNTTGEVPSPFSVPFVSPTRSGVDTMNVGLAWGITNQYRTPWLPTWLVMVEGRFAVGDPLRACSKGPIDPSGGAGNCRATYGASGTPGFYEGDGGISRGTNALRIETRGSHRYRYLEPYTGLAFQVEWPAASDRFFVPSGALEGVVNSIPPLLAEATVGLAVIPWEQRARYQRFTLDFRGTFAYVSEGRGWSPLFDALGTSSDTALTTPVCETDNGMPCDTSDASRRKGYFYGLTDTQSHARLGGRIAVEMQAARYVKFGFAAGLSYTTAHLLSFADACNPNFTPSAGDPRIGTCRSGIINPNYREAIDLPGRRFRLDGAMTFDLSATLTAQF
jgi:hypothetical protein